MFGRRSAAIRRSNLREGAVRGNRQIDEVRRVRAAGSYSPRICPSRRLSKVVIFC